MNALIDGSRARGRFMGLVHHTDAEREWAYDRKSPIGTLDKARVPAAPEGSELQPGPGDGQAQGRPRSEVT